MASNNHHCNYGRSTSPAPSQQQHQWRQPTQPLAIPMWPAWWHLHMQPSSVHCYLLWSLPYNATKSLNLLASLSTASNSIHHSPSPCTKATWTKPIRISDLTNPSRPTMPQHTVFQPKTQQACAATSVMQQ